MSKIKALINPVTPFQQNCSVIWKEDTKIAAVNDPGGDLEIIEKLNIHAHILVIHCTEYEDLFSEKYFDKKKCTI